MARIATDEAGSKSQESVSAASSVVGQTTTNQDERKSMNNKFDELTRAMAQSVTRRQAFKKFGVGLAGMALACFGLAEIARAGQGGCLKRGHTCGTYGSLKNWNCDKCCSGSYALSIT